MQDIDSGDAEPHEWTNKEGATMDSEVHIYSGEGCKKYRAGDLLRAG